MKILIINHFPLEGSGSGIYTRNLAEELVTMGHEVFVIFPEHKHVAFDTFESRPILFKSVKFNDASPIDLDFDIPCFTSHPRSSFTFYDMSEGQIKAYVNAFYRVTNQVVQTFKPDIIHAQHLWITPYIASKFDIPYVVTAHGTDLKGFVKDERYHEYALEGARKAQKIFTISKQVDVEVADLYHSPDEQRELILNGYNPALFTLKDLDPAKVLKDYGINYEGEKIVFFAGKLAHFKGVDLLLRAAKLYEDDQIITIIAGNGELYDELIDLKNQLNLKKTYFLGHIFQDALVDLYNIAVVSCVPSRTEPFGLVAIEALACGAPVVGTRQGGLPDFINDSVGRLVTPDDYEELSESISEILILNSTFSMRAQCHAYAENNFSRDISIKKVEAIYNQIIFRK